MMALAVLTAYLVSSCLLSPLIGALMRIGVEEAPRARGR